MTETILALILFLFPLAYSPGPGNMFFAATGARSGLRSAVPALVGYHVATWIVTVAIGLGILTALSEAPQVFAVLRLAGAAYVLWLAWTLLRSGVLQAEGTPKDARFVDGVMLLVLNPKAYVIIVLMFTQFLAPDDAGRFQPVAIIATVFTINNLGAFVVWTVAGDRIGAAFRTPGSARWLNAVFAAVLAGVAVWMAVA